MPTKRKELPSKEYLLSIYYEKDGLVFWKPRKMSRGRPLKKAHKRVNIFLDETNYLRIVIGKQTYMLSRIIYQMHYGDLTPDDEVDHVDRNKVNNTIGNLRKITADNNKRNTSKMVNNQSDVTGVTLNRKRHPPPYSHVISEYWAAKWTTSEGKAAAKHFSISKLGSEAAFEMAIAYRNTKINELRESGLMYSEDHGHAIDPTNAEEYIALNNIPRRTSRNKKDA
jgi:hypothetical protein